MISIERCLWCFVTCSSARSSFIFQMRQICKAWGASGHKWVLSQENRSGREGTILIPYLRAGRVLHVYSHGYKVEMMLVPHARPLLCRDTAFHCVTSSGWGRYSKFLLHSCSSAPECIKPPSQAEGCYQTNARKKKNICQSESSNFFKEAVLWWFSKQNKRHTACSVPLGTLQSGWKGRDLRRDFRWNEGMLETGRQHLERGAGIWLWVI